MANYLEIGWDSVTGAAKDVYDDVTGVTAAENTQEAQTQALNQARDYQREMYNESKGYLSPYKTAGDNVMFGEEQFDQEGNLTGRSGGLMGRVQGGDFLQDDFNYSGGPSDLTTKAQLRTHLKTQATNYSRVLTTKANSLVNLTTKVLDNKAKWVTLVGL